MRQLAEGFSYGDDITEKDIRIGDRLILFPGPRGEWSGLHGVKVERIGRVNVVASCDVRWAPNGPWHHQEHKVPKRQIDCVVRETTVHNVKRN